MLKDPVTEIKGVGSKFAENLAEMDIHTVGDLLDYFPYRYDVFEIKPLSELIHEDKVTIEGRIVNEPSLTFYGKKKSRLIFNMEVENVAVKAVMFNRAFAKKQLSAGELVTLTGKWDAHRLQITVSNYKKGPASEQTEIQPMYSLKGDVSNYKLKKAVTSAIEDYAGAVKEILPGQYLEAYKLPLRENAIITMHFPKSRIDLKHARRRFTYEEFLLFQLKMQLLRKIKRESTSGNAQHYDSKFLQEFIGSFPFTLTNAQLKSLNQILTDMKSSYRMNRLLQGDVGSGKTAVAAICMYASITAGKQAALMVKSEGKRS